MQDFGEMCKPRILTNSYSFHQIVTVFVVLLEKPNAKLQRFFFLHHIVRLWRSSKVSLFLSDGMHWEFVAPGRSAPPNEHRGMRARLMHVDFSLSPCSHSLTVSLHRT